MQNFINGLCLLIGAPKVGKSFFALNLGVAIAGGGEFLGHPVEQAGVLYLGLDDTPMRLKQRIATMIKGRQPVPEKLHLATNWRFLGNGGEAGIEAYLQKHLEIKLIIIDPLIKLRQFSEENYEIFNRLQNLIEKSGINILLTHHNDDILESISHSDETLNLVDKVLLLQRATKGVAHLHVYENRNDERREVLRFNAETFMWGVSDLKVGLSNGKSDKAIRKVIW